MNEKYAIGIHPNALLSVVHVAESREGRQEQQIRRNKEYKGHYIRLEHLR